MNIREDLSNLNGSAVAMTHGLKEQGNGNMFDGLVKIGTGFLEVGRKLGISEGEKTGIKKGRIQGAVIMVALFGIVNAIPYAYKKIEEVKKANDNEPEFVKELSNEQIQKYSIDTDFPWEDVKNHMKENGYVTETSFDMWVKPLGCRAYEDRVLVEVIDEKVSCEYISKMYKKIIQESIFELTGKIYIVSIVRPGEILIEDMD